jgi:hydroxymethylbilane synthase
VLQALEQISDAATAAALMAERAFLAELDGSCRTPIAGLARLEAGRLRLRGEVLRPDGSETFAVAAESARADAARLGREAGRDLKARLPEGVLVNDA